jgi:hypothetical protein
MSERVRKKSAEMAADEMRKALLMAWTPNSMMTILMKSGTLPLVSTGAMHDAIKAWKEPDGSWVGGIDPTLKHPESHLTIGTIAQILSSGMTISVTEPMRHYLAARGFPLKSTTVALTVPPRPFLQAANMRIVARVQEEAGKIVMPVVRI